MKSLLGYYIMETTRTYYYLCDTKRPKLYTVVTVLNNSENIESIKYQREDYDVVRWIQNLYRKSFSHLQSIDPAFIIDMVINIER